MGSTCDEGLDKINAEEAKEVDERGDEGDNGGDFRQGNDMKRSGASNLVAPAVKEVVSDGEEERKENGIG